MTRRTRHDAIFGEPRHAVRFAGPGATFDAGFFELINDTDFALIGAADRALIQGA